MSNEGTSIRAMSDISDGAAFNNGHRQHRHTDRWRGRESEQSREEWWWRWMEEQGKERETEWWRHGGIKDSSTRLLPYPLIPNRVLEDWSVSPFAVGQEVFYILHPGHISSSHNPITMLLLRTPHLAVGVFLSLHYPCSGAPFTLWQLG